MCYQQSQKCIKISSLCNTVIEAEAYMVQTGLPQGYNNQRFCHILVHYSSPQDASVARVHIDSLRAGSGTTERAAIARRSIPAATEEQQRRK
jgi:hypothetical protein